MAFEEDLDAFFDEEGPGNKLATWSGAPASPIVVGFDPQYHDGMGLVDGTFTAIVVPLASVPGITHGQTFAIDATTYKVVRVMRHQGSPGVALVQLETQ